MKNVKKKKLGERLIERGSISQENLKSALSEQRGKTILLGDLLLARGLVSKVDLAGTLKEVLASTMSMSLQLVSTGVFLS
jgi:type IV pilus assembly protein PilB